MDTTVQVEVECEEPGCKNSITLELDTTKFRCGEELDEIVGIPSRDIAVALFERGWKANLINKGFRNVECYRHGMGKEMDKRIKALSEENDWSKEYEEGFREAVARTPLEPSDL